MVMNNNTWYLVRNKVLYACFALFSRVDSVSLSILAGVRFSPSDLPYNQVPILEVDGTVIPQSLAQIRYVGKIGGTSVGDLCSLDQERRAQYPVRSVNASSKREGRGAEVWLLFEPT